MSHRPFSARGRERFLQTVLALDDKHNAPAPGANAGAAHEAKDVSRIVGQDGLFVGGTISAERSVKLAPITVGPVDVTVTTTATPQPQPQSGLHNQSQASSSQASLAMAQHSPFATHPAQPPRPVSARPQTSLARPRTNSTPTSRSGSATNAGASVGAAGVTPLPARTVSHNVSGSIGADGVNLPTLRRPHTAHSIHDDEQTGQALTVIKRDQQRAERARRQVLNNERNQVFAYLASPACHLFENLLAPCPLSEHDLDLLLEAGRATQNTLALLADLNRRGVRVQSFNDLLHRVRELEADNSEVCAHVARYLSSPNCPIFIQSASTGKCGPNDSASCRNITEADIANIVAEARSTPMTVVSLLKGLAASGTRVASLDELASLVRDAEIAAANASQANANAQTGIIVTEADRARVVGFLSGPDSPLIPNSSRAKSNTGIRVAASELDAIIVDAGGAQQCIQLLRTLAQEKGKFADFTALSAALHAAKVSKAKAAKDTQATLKILFQYLSSPQCMLFEDTTTVGMENGEMASGVAAPGSNHSGGVSHDGTGLNNDALDPSIHPMSVLKVTESDLLAILAEASGDVKRAIRLLKDLELTGRRFSNMAQLISALQDGKTWAVSEKDRQLMIDYISSPECQLFIDVEEVRVSKTELNALLAAGRALTPFLVRQLNMMGRRFRTIPQLTQAVKLEYERAKEIKLAVLSFLRDPERGQLLFSQARASTSERHSLRDSHPDSVRLRKSTSNAVQVSITAADVDRLYVESEAGHETLTVLQSLLGRNPPIVVPDMEGLTAVVRSHFLAARRALQDQESLAGFGEEARRALIAYFSALGRNGLFDIPSEGAEIVLQRSELDSLLKEAHGLDNALFFLGLLSRQGEKKYKSFQHLIEDVKREYDVMTDCKQRLFRFFTADTRLLGGSGPPADSKTLSILLAPNSSAPDNDDSSALTLSASSASRNLLTIADCEAFYKKCNAGAESLQHLANLASSGLRMNSLDDVASAVRAAAEAELNSKQARKERQRVSLARSAIREYLKSTECQLFQVPLEVEIGGGYQTPLLHKVVSREHGSEKQVHSSNDGSSPNGLTDGACVTTLYASVLAVLHSGSGIGSGSAAGGAGPIMAAILGLSSNRASPTGNKSRLLGSDTGDAFHFSAGSAMSRLLTNSLVTRKTMEKFRLVKAENTPGFSTFHGDTYPTATASADAAPLKFTPAWGVENANLNLSDADIDAMLLCGRSVSGLLVALQHLSFAGYRFLPSQITGNKSQSQSLTQLSQMVEQQQQQASIPLSFSSKPSLLDALRHFRKQSLRARSAVLAYLTSPATLMFIPETPILSQPGSGESGQASLAQGPPFAHQAASGMPSSSFIMHPKKRAGLELQRSLCLQDIDRIFYESEAGLLTLSLLKALDCRTGGIVFFAPAGKSLLQDKIGDSRTAPQESHGQVEAAKQGNGSERDAPQEPLPASKVAVAYLVTLTDTMAEMPSVSAVAASGSTGAGVSLVTEKSALLDSMKPLIGHREIAMSPSSLADPNGVIPSRFVAKDVESIIAELKYMAPLARAVDALGKECVRLYLLSPVCELFVQPVTLTPMLLHSIWTAAGGDSLSVFYVLFQLQQAKQVFSTPEELLVAVTNYYSAVLGPWQSFTTSDSNSVVRDSELASLAATSQAVSRANLTAAYAANSAGSISSSVASSPALGLPQKPPTAGVVISNEAAATQALEGQGPGVLNAVQSPVAAVATASAPHLILRRQVAQLLFIMMLRGQLPNFIESMNPSDMPKRRLVPSASSASGSDARPGPHMAKELFDGDYSFQPAISRAAHALLMTTTTRAKAMRAEQLQELELRAIIAENALWAATDFLLRECADLIGPGITFYLSLLAAENHVYRSVERLLIALKMKYAAQRTNTSQAASLILAAFVTHPECELWPEDSPARMDTYRIILEKAAGNPLFPEYAAAGMHPELPASVFGPLDLALARKLVAGDTSSSSGDHLMPTNEEASTLSGSSHSDLISMAKSTASLVPYARRPYYPGINLAKNELLDLASIEPFTLVFEGLLDQKFQRRQFGTYEDLERAVRAAIAEPLRICEALKNSLVSKSSPFLPPLSSTLPQLGQLAEAARTRKTGGSTFEDVSVLAMQQQQSDQPWTLSSALRNSMAQGLLSRILYNPYFSGLSSYAIISRAFTELVQYARLQYAQSSSAGMSTLGSVTSPASTLHHEGASHVAMITQAEAGIDLSSPALAASALVRSVDAELAQEAFVRREEFAMLYAYVNAPGRMLLPSNVQWHMSDIARLIGLASNSALVVLVALINAEREAAMEAIERQVAQHAEARQQAESAAAEAEEAGGIIRQKSQPTMGEAEGASVLALAQKAPKTLRSHHSMRLASPRQMDTKSNEMDGANMDYAQIESSALTVEEALDLFPDSPLQKIAKMASIYDMLTEPVFRSMNALCNYIQFRTQNPESVGRLLYRFLSHPACRLLPTSLVRPSPAFLHGMQGGSGDVESSNPTDVISMEAVTHSILSVVPPQYALETLGFAWQLSAARAQFDSLASLAMAFKALRSLPRCRSPLQLLWLVLAAPLSPQALASMCAESMALTSGLLLDDEYYAQGKEVLLKASLKDGSSPSTSNDRAEDNRADTTQSISERQLSMIREVVSRVKLLSSNCYHRLTFAEGSRKITLDDVTRLAIACSHSCYLALCTLLDAESLGEHLVVFAKNSFSAAETGAAAGMARLLSMFTSRHNELVHARSQLRAWLVAGEGAILFRHTLTPLTFPPPAIEYLWVAGRTGRRTLAVLMQLIAHEHGSIPTSGISVGYVGVIPAIHNLEELVRVLMHGGAQRTVREREKLAEALRLERARVEKQEREAEQRYLTNLKLRSALSASGILAALWSPMATRAFAMRTVEDPATSNPKVESPLELDDGSAYEYASAFTAMKAPKKTLSSVLIFTSSGKQGLSSVGTPNWIITEDEVETILSEVQRPACVPEILGMLLAEGRKFDTVRQLADAVREYENLDLVLKRDLLGFLRRSDLLIFDTLGVRSSGVPADSMKDEQDPAVHSNGATGIAGKKLLTLEDVDTLVEKAGAGLHTYSICRWLNAARQRFVSLNDLATAVNTAFKVTATIRASERNMILTHVCGPVFRDIIRVPTSHQLATSATTLLSSVVITSYANSQTSHPQGDVNSLPVPVAPGSFSTPHRASPLSAEWMGERFADRILAVSQSASSAIYLLSSFRAAGRQFGTGVELLLALRQAEKDMNFVRVDILRLLMMPTSRLIATPTNIAQRTTPLESIDAEFPTPAPPASATSAFVEPGMAVIEAEEDPEVVLELLLAMSHALLSGYVDPLQPGLAKIMLGKLASTNNEQATAQLGVLPVPLPYVATPSDLYVHTWLMNSELSSPISSVDAGMNLAQALSAALGATERRMIYARAGGSIMTAGLSSALKNFGIPPGNLMDSAANAGNAEHALTSASVFAIDTMVRRAAATAAREALVGYLASSHCTLLTKRSPNAADDYVDMFATTGDVTLSLAQVDQLINCCAGFGLVEDPWNTIEDWLKAEADEDEMTGNEYDYPYLAVDSQSVTGPAATKLTENRSKPAYPGQKNAAQAGVASATAAHAALFSLQLLNELGLTFSTFGELLHALQKLQAWMASERLAILKAIQEDSTLQQVLNWVREHIDVLNDCLSGSATNAASTKPMEVPQCEPAKSLGRRESLDLGSLISVVSEAKSEFDELPEELKIQRQSTMMMQALKLGVDEPAELSNFGNKELQEPIQSSPESNHMVVRNSAAIALPAHSLYVMNPQLAKMFVPVHLHLLTMELVQSAFFAPSLGIQPLHHKEELEEELSRAPESSRPLINRLYELQITPNRLLLLFSDALSRAGLAVVGPQDLARALKSWNNVESTAAQKTSGLETSTSMHSRNIDVVAMLGIALGTGTNTARRTWLMVQLRERPLLGSKYPSMLERHRLLPADHSSKPSDSQQETTASESSNPALTDAFDESKANEGISGIQPEGEGQSNANDQQNVLQTALEECVEVLESGLEFATEIEHAQQELITTVSNIATPIVEQPSAQRHEQPDSYCESVPVSVRLRTEIGCLRLRQKEKSNDSIYDPQETGKNKPVADSEYAYRFILAYPLDGRLVSLPTSSVQSDVPNILTATDTSSSMSLAPNEALMAWITDPTTQLPHISEDILAAAGLVGSSLLPSRACAYSEVYPIPIMPEDPNLVAANSRLVASSMILPYMKGYGNVFLFRVYQITSRNVPNAIFELARLAAQTTTAGEAVQVSAQNTERSLAMQPTTITNNMCAPGSLPATAGYYEPSPLAPLVATPSAGRDAALFTLLTMLDSLLTSDTWSQPTLLTDELVIADGVIDLNQLRSAEHPYAESHLVRPALVSGLSQLASSDEPASTLAKAVKALDSSSKVIGRIVVSTDVGRPRRLPLKFSITNPPVSLMRRLRALLAKLVHMQPQVGSITAENAADLIPQRFAQRVLSFSDDEIARAIAEVSGQATASVESSSLPLIRILADCGAAYSLPASSLTFPLSGDGGKEYDPASQLGFRLIVDAVRKELSAAYDTGSDGASDEGEKQVPFKHEDGRVVRIAASKLDQAISNAYKSIATTLGAASQAESNESNVDELISQLHMKIAKETLNAGPLGLIQSRDQLVTSLELPNAPSSVQHALPALIVPRFCEVGKTECVSATGTTVIFPSRVCVRMGTGAVDLPPQSLLSEDETKLHLELPGEFCSSAAKVRIQVLDMSEVDSSSLNADPATEESAQSQAALATLTTDAGQVLHHIAHEAELDLRALVSAPLNRKLNTRTLKIPLSTATIFNSTLMRALNLDPSDEAPSDECGILQQIISELIPVFSGFDNPSFMKGPEDTAQTAPSSDSAASSVETSSRSSVSVDMELVLAARRLLKAVLHADSLASEGGSAAMLGSSLASWIEVSIDEDLLKKWQEGDSRVHLASVADHERVLRQARLSVESHLQGIVSKYVSKCGEIISRYVNHQVTQMLGKSTSDEALANPLTFLEQIVRLLPNTPYAHVISANTWPNAAEGTTPWTITPQTVAEMAQLCGNNVVLCAFFLWRLFEGGWISKSQLAEITQNIASDASKQPDAVGSASAQFAEWLKSTIASMYTHHVIQRQSLRAAVKDLLFADVMNDPPAEKSAIWADTKAVCAKRRRRIAELSGLRGRLKDAWTVGVERLSRDGLPQDYLMSPFAASDIFTANCLVAHSTNVFRQDIYPGSLMTRKGPIENLLKQVNTGSDPTTESRADDIIPPSIVEKMNLALSTVMFSDAELDSMIFCAGSATSAGLMLSQLLDSEDEVPISPKPISTTVDLALNTASASQLVYDPAADLVSKLSGMHLDTKATKLTASLQTKLESVLDNGVSLLIPSPLHSLMSLNGVQVRVPLQLPPILSYHAAPTERASSNTAPLDAQELDDEPDLAPQSLSRSILVGICVHLYNQYVSMQNRSTKVGDMGAIPAITLASLAADIETISPLLFAPILRAKSLAAEDAQTTFEPPQELSAPEFLHSLVFEVGGDADVASAAIKLLAASNNLGPREFGNGAGDNLAQLVQKFVPVLHAELLARLRMMRDAGIWARLSERHLITKCVVELDRPVSQSSLRGLDTSAAMTRVGLLIDPNELDENKTGRKSSKWQAALQAASGLVLQTVPIIPNRFIDGTLGKVGNSPVATSPLAGVYRCEVTSGAPFVVNASHIACWPRMPAPPSLANSLQVELGGAERGTTRPSLSGGVTPESSSTLDPAICLRLLVSKNSSIFNLAPGGAFVDVFSQFLLDLICATLAVPLLPHISNIIAAVEQEAETHQDSDASSISVDSSGAKHNVFDSYNSYALIRNLRAALVLHQLRLDNSAKEDVRSLVLSNVFRGGAAFAQMMTRPFASVSSLTTCVLSILVRDEDRLALGKYLSSPAFDGILSPKPPQNLVPRSRSSRSGPQPKVDGQSADNQGSTVGTVYMEDSDNLIATALVLSPDQVLEMLAASMRSRIVSGDAWDLSLPAVSALNAVQSATTIPAFLPDAGDQLIANQDLETALLATMKPTSTCKAPALPSFAATAGLAISRIFRPKVSPRVVQVGQTLMARYQSHKLALTAGESLCAGLEEEALDRCINDMAAMQLVTEKVESGQQSTRALLHKALVNITKGPIFGQYSISNQQKLQFFYPFPLNEDSINLWTDAAAAYRALRIVRAIALYYVRGALTRLRQNKLSSNDTEGDESQPSSPGRSTKHPDTPSRFPILGLRESECIPGSTLPGSAFELLNSILFSGAEVDELSLLNIPKAQMQESSRTSKPSVSANLHPLWQNIDPTDWSLASAQGRCAELECALRTPTTQRVLLRDMYSVFVIIWAQRQLANEKVWRESSVKAIKCPFLPFTSIDEWHESLKTFRSNVEQKIIALVRAPWFALADLSEQAKLTAPVLVAAARGVARGDGVTDINSFLKPQTSILAIEHSRRTSVDIAMASAEAAATAAMAAATAAAGHAPESDAEAVSRIEAEGGVSKGGDREGQDEAQDDVAGLGVITSDSEHQALEPKATENESYAAATLQVAETEQQDASASSSTAEVAAENVESPTPENAPKVETTEAIEAAVQSVDAEPTTAVMNADDSNVHSDSQLDTQTTTASGVADPATAPEESATQAEVVSSETGAEDTAPSQALQGVDSQLTEQRIEPFSQNDEINRSEEPPANTTDVALTDVVKDSSVDHQESSQPPTSSESVEQSNASTAPVEPMEEASKPQAPESDVEQQATLSNPTVALVDSADSADTPTQETSQSDPSKDETRHQQIESKSDNEPVPTQSVAEQVQVTEQVQSSSAPEQTDQTGNASSSVENAPIKQEDGSEVLPSNECTNEPPSLPQDAATSEPQNDSASKEMTEENDSEANAGQQGQMEPQQQPETQRQAEDQPVDVAMSQSESPQLEDASSHQEQRQLEQKQVNEEHQLSQAQQQAPEQTHVQTTEQSQPEQSDQMIEQVSPSQQVEDEQQTQHSQSGQEQQDQRTEQQQPVQEQSQQQQQPSVSSASEVPPLDPPLTDAEKEDMEGFEEILLSSSLLPDSNENVPQELLGLIFRYCGGELVAASENIDALTSRVASELGEAGVKTPEDLLVVVRSLGRDNVFGVLRDMGFEEVIPSTPLNPDAQRAVDRIVLKCQGFSSVPSKLKTILEDATSNGEPITSFNDIVSLVQQ